LATLALFAAAGCRDGGDPEDFESFAGRVARAAERGDTDFFAERVEGRPYTCSEADVEASTGPDAPEEPICLEVGHEFEAVPIDNYGAAGTITTPAVLIRDIERFFDQALPEAEDDFGSGAVRLYATAVPQRQPGTASPLRTAVLTSLQEFQGAPRRFVRALDFEFLDGRWVIRSETTAGFPIATDLLRPNTAVLLYEEWKEY
jgi:hypothetical protein